MKVLVCVKVGLLVTVGLLLLATVKEGKLSFKSSKGPWWSKDSIAKVSYFSGGDILVANVMTMLRTERSETRQP